MSRPTFLGSLIGKHAGQVELVNAETGAVLAGYLEAAFDSKTRKKGLLGRNGVPDDYALVLAPCSAVHTFFMRFPIDILFVSRDGTVTKTSKSVNPWRLAGSFRAYAVIEAAAGFIERHEIVPGERVEVREIPLKRRASDALPAVASAGELPPAASPGRHGTHKRVTLADISAEKVPLEWFESVAIVQGLCEAVLGRGPVDDVRVPELKHIALTPEGRVRLLSDGPSGHSPVNRAGLVLLALTPEAQLPLQLRLLVLEEVSPRPRLAGLREFHQELEFFERPDRLAIVRDVHARFQQGEVSKQSATPVPAPLLEPPPPKGRFAWWHRRSARTAAALVLMVLLAAGGAWAWRHPQAQWIKDRMKRVPTLALDSGKAVVGRIRAELDSPRWRIGSRPRPPEPSVLVLAEPSTSAPAPSTVGREGGAMAPAILPGDLPTLPRASFPATAPSPGAASQEALAATPTPADVPSGAIYTAADSPQVLPPVLISPRTRAGEPAGRGGGPQAEVEVLVSSTGEVETVKLVSGQTTALSGMQVSAIKAWRFQPATRGGVPVRYQLRMPLTVR